MSIKRREFLGRGLTAGASLGVGACLTSRADAPPPSAPLSSWSAVRAEFPLSREHIHFALMLLASHPRPVRDAIERHRRAFDDNPAAYFEEKFFTADGETRQAAAKYMGGAAGDIALTDSTTMGLGVLYGGLILKDGDEILCTTHDHYATHENLRLRALRSGGGVSVRKVALYEDPATVSEEQLVARLVKAVAPKTRVVGVTWVHSSTGVKLPIRAFATALEELNRKRDEKDRLLFCVDGVHGFGVEKETPAELGCDFFAAGCHKWIFGPRGTGVLWGRPAAWKKHVPVIASFEKEPYEAWMKGQVPAGPGGNLGTPGGFHSFEHRWALPEAFAFHERIGRARITSRIHELTKQCKEGLADNPKVTLHTPKSEALSAGLICFEVKGIPAADVIKRLAARKIVGSVTPYATEYARFSVGILNTPEEVDTVLREVRSLA
jgi:isopenicillin-N epimerase